MGKRVQVRTTITMDEGLRDKFMEYAESLGSTFPKQVELLIKRAMEE
jgi:hypothetical protein